MSGPLSLRALLDADGPELLARVGAILLFAGLALFAGSRVELATTYSPAPELRATAGLALAAVGAVVGAAGLAWTWRSSTARE